MNRAELYAETNTNQYRDAQEILNEYKQEFKWGENERILDIGCGPGNTTANLIFPIIPTSAKLLGSDISVEMIKFAQRTYENDRLSFTTLDISADNITEMLENEKFDKVFSFYCLHWIPDQKKAVENVWKLMKPNGTALLVLVSRSPLFTLYKWLSNQPKWKEYMLDVKDYISPYQETSNPSEIYKNLLQNVGFKVIKCYDKLSSVQVPTLQELEKSLEAVNPFLNRMSPNVQREYMKSIMEAIVDKELIKLTQNKKEIKYITPNKLTIAFCQKNTEK